MHPLEFTTGIKFSSFIAEIFDFILAVVITLFCFYLISDILKLLHIYPEYVKEHRGLESLVFIVISLTICFIGYINALTPTTMRYEISTNKNHLKDELKVVVISDLHIGSTSMTPAKLQKSVEKINALKADLIFILGDTFDGRGSYQEFINSGYDSILQQLKSGYGVFAITGNHEYYMPETVQAIALMTNIGIKVLQDDSVYIKELNTYIIGRKDPASSRTGKGRMTLPQIMKRPQYRESDSLFLVLDHNPAYVSESREVLADVQFSGHTHNGQLFPLNLIEKFLYETSWGLSEKDNTTLFVSSGLGMWGPAVRTSAVSEIALITIKKVLPKDLMQ